MYHVHVTTENKCFLLLYNLRISQICEGQLVRNIKQNRIKLLVACPSLVKKTNPCVYLKTIAFYQ